MPYELWDDTHLAYLGEENDATVRRAISLKTRSRLLDVRTNFQWNFI
jgi:hypothetical protein